ncbi:type I methionyl aminopeptidase [Alicyclobacillus sp. SO9]|uniref:type I methionyl aminopeptidase n=1 Tax=Alicyclobacillus sp. SO9 TaxID=2665646 RepID=UPI0018E77B14|nr:type I methionyl aminopeptidase [Alicyclobacillus sp. SO9]QQE81019.1 type I methionyl aminopeptidase [Alicyclobacillus sp. SO9]
MVYQEGDIEKLRTCGAINAAIHRRIYNVLRPGISTAEIDEFAGELMRKTGVISSIIAEGFPGHICVSRNEEVGHGVPGTAILRSGDIVKIDIAVSYQGLHTDCAQTYIVDRGHPALVALLKNNKRALWAGIAHAKPGNRCSDISGAIHRKISGTNYRAVRQVFGHGVGTELHESPSIPNYGPDGFGQRLHAGMVLAIEPIMSLGSPFMVRQSNGWTDATVDNSYSAHFEHTVLITQGAAEVLTKDAESGIFANT